jgi:hypothetical protein
VKKIVLKDFEKWKELNKENGFSTFDYIFHVVNEKNINSDLFFAFFELFWPSFIVYNEYVFLENNFSIKKVEDLVQRNLEVEFWVNLFIVSPYFQNQENEDEKSEFFTKSLVEFWQRKLAKEFPQKNFIIEYIYDEESGDYGLTFYQKNLLEIPINSSKS